MHRTKRLGFLVAACDRLRELIPDFELVALGDGPEAHVLDSAAARRPWLHRVGPVFGPARVPYLLAGKLILMPGAVGLAVLDSFALGVPVVATDAPTNGPEAAYIEQGRNGLVLPRGISSRRYGEAVAALLGDPRRLVAMRRRCLNAADAHTVEKMAGRFADGVVSALKAPLLRCPLVPPRRGPRMRRATRAR
jgi:glycosyltransferase involved in cell wall biosynthesis